MLRNFKFNPILIVFALSFLTSVVPKTALSDGLNNKPKWLEFIPSEMQALPEGVLKWYIGETDYLSRDVDLQRIVSPKLNSQDPKYLPEAKIVFDLLGVWMPTNQLHVFKSESGINFNSQFERKNANGESESLFLIHPESLDLYKPFLNLGFETTYFRAAATSSSRSLLVWRKGLESKPFIAKVSLNKFIAEVDRNVKGAETAKSIGISATLEGSNNLPKNFLYMKESFSAIPKGMARGGMILREFPDEMIHSETYFIPLFALYGESKPGFLLTMIQSSDQPVETILREQILNPFAKIWSQLALQHGILIEPHAQNVLVEVKNNKLTGRFMFRDFGGFTIDFDFRKHFGLFVPKHLPTFTGSIFDDYSLKYYAKNISKSLYNYFEGGFLYNIKASLNNWKKNGWIKNQNVNIDLYKNFRDEVTKEVEKITNVKVEIDSAYENLESYVEKNRKAISIKSSPQRIGFFSGTFDPPHDGHREIIEKSIRELNLDSIIVVTGIEQKHKSKASPYEIRDAMARAAFKSIAGVQFLNKDQFQTHVSGGIAALQKKLSRDYEKSTIYQIMGDDSLVRLQNRDDVHFPKNFVIAVASRSENSEVPADLLNKTRVVVLSPDLRNYSSTTYRKTLGQGKNPAQVAESVIQIIRDNNLYRGSDLMKCSMLFK